VSKRVSGHFLCRLTLLTWNSVFRQIYTQFILLDTQKLTRTYDRKTAVVSLTKTLADSQAFVSRYQKGWALTCEALLKLLVNPPVPTDADLILVERDIDEIGFSAGFTALSTCTRPSTDPFPQIADVRVWTGQYLKEADQRNGGRISEYVQNRLSEEARNALIQYMS
jgi:exportin-2 (importin alpha re-exporter)